MTRTWLVPLVTTSLLLGAMPGARAAQLTDVADAFDGEDPFDAHVFISFYQDYRWAKITKEFYNQGLGIADGRDLRITEKTNYMQIDLEAGIWKDLSLTLSLPIAISHEYGAEFANGVNTSNSELYRGWFVGDLDRNPFSSSHAAGMGDLHLILKWAPFNCEREREEWWPTWLLFMDVMFPSGDPWDPSEDFYNRFTGTSKKSGLGVGKGYYEMTFGTALSRRFSAFDPYMGFHYTLPLLASRSRIYKNVDRSMVNSEWASDGTRIANYNDGRYFGQMYYNNDRSMCYSSDPNHPVCQIHDRGDGRLYPQEDRNDNAYPHGRPGSGINEWSSSQIEAIRDNIMLPHHFGLVFGTEIVPWEVDDGTQRLAVDIRLKAEVFTEGVSLNELSDLLNRPTYAEQYARYEGAFTLIIQPWEYIMLRAGVTLAHETEHFLTYADEASNRFSGPTGEDLPDAYFDKRLDSVGQRVRVFETFLFQWMITLAGKF